MTSSVVVIRNLIKPVWICGKRIEFKSNWSSHAYLFSEIRYEMRVMFTYCVHSRCFAFIAMLDVYLGEQRGLRCVVIEVNCWSPFSFLRTRSVVARKHEWNKSSWCYLGLLACKGWNTQIIVHIATNFVLSPQSEDVSSDEIVARKKVCVKNF